MKGEDTSLQIELEKIFQKKSAIVRHFADQGIYHCQKCGKSYSRAHSLNRHVKFECGVEPQFECPICHKKSKHKHNLLLHMRIHKSDIGM